MEKPKTRIDINVADAFKLYHPLLAAVLLNTIYSALTIKKLSGVEVTENLFSQTRDEIYEQFWVMADGIADAFDEDESQTS